jgi:phytoene synthase
MQGGTMTDSDYALQRLGAGSSQYYCHRFLPPRERAWLMALRALAAEISEIGEECRDRELAHAKLDWWRRELQHAFDGRASHPVTHALQPVIRAGLLAQSPLQDLVETSARDIAPVRFGTFVELHRHAQQTHGVIEALCAGILGNRDAAINAVAVELGAIHALCRQLAELGADVRRDRLYLPADDLARHGVREADIFGLRETDAWRALVSERVNWLLTSYDRILDAVPEPGRVTLIPGIALAAQNRALLHEITHLQYSLLSNRIALTPLRRLWITWHTLRRERRRDRG